MRHRAARSGRAPGVVATCAVATLLAVGGLVLVPVPPCAADPGRPAEVAAAGTGGPAAGATRSTAGAALSPPSPPPASVPLPGLEAAAAAAGGTISAVVLSPGGDLLAGTAASREVPSASLTKVLVVAELLHQQLTGGVRLEPRDLDRMARAISSSDDDAMNALWVAFDGAGLIGAATRRFGLTGTAPPAEIGQWGEARTTARDVATVLAGLARGPDAVGRTVLRWLREATPTAADGFDQRFGLLSPAVGSGAGAKQGWMCCVGGRRHLHSAGVLADGRVVVLLGDFPSSTSWERARAALDRAAPAAVTATG